MGILNRKVDIHLPVFDRLEALGFHRNVGWVAPTWEYSEANTESWVYIKVQWFEEDGWGSCQVWGGPAGLDGQRLFDKDFEDQACLLNAVKAYII